MKHFLIDIIAFTTIISTLLVITSKNPVISVVYLVSLFINAACYLILLGVGFIGISYIIVYIGAIAVLFLFIIMMINVEVRDIIETGSQYTKTVPLALGIGLLFFFEIYNIIPFSFNNLSSISSLLNLLTKINILIIEPQLIRESLVYIVSNPIIADTNFFNLSQIESIGQILYTDGSFLLIICSIILLLAMIAPIFIGRK